MLIEYSSVSCSSLVTQSEIDVPIWHSFTEMCTPPQGVSCRPGDSELPQSLDPSAVLELNLLKPGHIAGSYATSVNW